MTHGARPDVLVVDMALGGITGADMRQNPSAPDDRLGVRHLL